MRPKAIASMIVSAMVTRSRIWRQYGLLGGAWNGGGRGPATTLRHRSARVTAGYR